MHVAIVSTPFVAVPPPAYGGTELVVDALARALVRAGHRVAVFATGDSRVPGLRATFEAPVWPPEPYAELLHCRFAAAEIARGGFDVVHAHLPAMLAFAGALPAPVVYTLHHAPDPALARFYARVPAVLRVAISRRQAELSSPPAHRVIHHGLDPALYPDVREGDGGGGAFFLGRLSWCKAPEVAVEAARRAGLRIDVAGDVHGEDDHPEAWDEEVLSPSLAAPHVSWARRAGLADKRRLLARARALLVPLRWEEPFGLVMIEALLAGCPVVAFPLGAAPEIVVDGADGFLVRSAAEMAAALGRAARLDRREIQRRARERFSADRMAADYVAAYRAAAARAEPTVPAVGEGGEWTTVAP
ncbi:glycosyl transferase group 1 [Anaeromyxobacter sp. K]|uniref:glycosyltransferase n=1 Tax=Anaeromyxobacter sp. (strain K) TaxID=447217 RepID=UPI00017BE1E3|nr:glycosyltransferase [Anaeromyxobacter sp. K]ACG74028.1 glycosyl transferase group 1 [Anaeromyxobacter sp. K]